MNTKSQLLKGSLEGCVLKIIELKGETYGYEIAKLLKENGFDDISEGTLYPLYTRLQKNKLIESSVRESPLGPLRKYYRLTEKGYQELDHFIYSWNKLIQNVNDILKGRI
ncbi:PadR family transcriptional regulator [Anaerovorax sp. IOR16]|uniref:PadR family transcriptional regulator n=1 Tax=Anaerovorax sp. IOR16 TaxID=2773458 RepID=UPI0019D07739|nr:PadR family transcriptional regulator [Anaerovorax sp. IOR16]